MGEWGFTLCTISSRNGKIIHHLTTEEDGSDLMVKRVTAGLLMSVGVGTACSGIKQQVVLSDDPLKMNHKSFV